MIKIINSCISFGWKIAAGLLLLIMFLLILKALSREKKEKTCGKGSCKSILKYWFLMIPLFGILYLGLLWLKFSGTFVEFILTKKILELIFGIALVSYLVNYFSLSALDCERYARFSRKLSGWVIVLVFIGLIFSRLGISWVGVFGTSLANRKPVEVYRNGSIAVVYKPAENIRQEVNLDLLPGRRYRIEIVSKLKWENFESTGNGISRKVIHSVPSNGLPWTIKQWRALYGAKGDNYPVKDEDTGFGGIVVGIDGENCWIVNRSIVQGKKLLAITLNDNQKDFAFQKYRGLVVITLIPQ